jgi:hypothetical protein
MRKSLALQAIIGTLNGVTIFDSRLTLPEAENVIKRRGITLDGTSTKIQSVIIYCTLSKGRCICLSWAVIKEKEIIGVLVPARDRNYFFVLLTDKYLHSYLETKKIYFGDRKDLEEKGAIFTDNCCICGRKGIYFTGAQRYCSKHRQNAIDRLVKVRNLVDPEQLFISKEVEHNSKLSLRRYQLYKTKQRHK